jgi:hypothetical protein
VRPQKRSLRSWREFLLDVRKLTLYSKAGCHLCDEMKHVIETVSTRVPISLEVIEITTDPELEDRYGLEIPVLLIDGKKAAKYRITQEDLERRLRTAATQHHS